MIAMVVHICCLSACAESGLKFLVGKQFHPYILSLCLRGEWIEIERGEIMADTTYGLSACAESGLKYVINLQC